MASLGLTRISGLPLLLRNPPIRLQHGQYGCVCLQPRPTGSCSLGRSPGSQTQITDFGKNIIPNLLNTGGNIYAYPYSGYWVDVGTTSFLLASPYGIAQVSPSLNLNNRSWIIHTRTEERPPVLIARNAVVEDSLICDGCVIEPGARVIRSILSPGVVVRAGTNICESIILTDSLLEAGCSIERSILDKRVKVAENTHIGTCAGDEIKISMVGKNSDAAAQSDHRPGRGGFYRCNPIRFHLPPRRWAGNRLYQEITV